MWIWLAERQGDAGSNYHMATRPLAYLHNSALDARPYDFTGTWPDLTATSQQISQQLDAAPGIGEALEQLRPYNRQCNVL
jgi:hypothetical protein